MSWRALVEAAEAIRSAVVAGDASVADLPLAGIGWATVEHERAVRELDTLLGAGSWEAMGSDAALGARSWRRTAVGPDGVSGGPHLIVLEPDTEGRLAASLARFGEGVAVVYVGHGPAGPGRVIRGGPTWGPHVVVVYGVGSYQRSRRSTSSSGRRPPGCGGRLRSSGSAG